MTDKSNWNQQIAPKWKERPQGNGRSVWIAEFGDSPGVVIRIRSRQDALNLFPRLTIIQAITDIIDSRSFEVIAQVRWRVAHQYETLTDGVSVFYRESY